MIIQKPLVKLRSSIVEPNFLVIGGQKCATSWLARNIKHHPDTFTPVKDELHFFNKRANYRKGIEFYRSQFIGYCGQKAIGEFTPNYFWTSENAQEIREHDLNYDIPKCVKRYYPNMKLIVSLRNPVHRAISAYYHHIRKRRVNPNSRILDVGDKYGIISMGFYDIHLKKWLEHFEPSSFLILILEEDIAQKPYETLKEVYQFIGIDSSFKPKNAAKKVGTMKSHFYTRASCNIPQLLAKMLYIVLPSNFQEADFWKTKVSDSEVEELRQIYLKHNEQLSSLISRKLTSWK